MTRCIVLMLALVLLLSSAFDAGAHDPSAYGGVYRSRNLGEVWLNADAGLFLNAALTVAVDPRDPNHLLMGTDLGLLDSRNGGRSWSPEAQGLIVGAVFAATFSPDGQSAICAAPSGVFRFHDGQWTRAVAPDGAAPTRAIVFGAVPKRIYLLGKSGLFASEDGGESFSQVQQALPVKGEMTALAVATQPKEILLAVVDGKLMASDDGGRQWKRRADALGEIAFDTTVLDVSLPSRVWTAGANQLYMSDDLGVTWRAVGRPLPEAGTSVRGIAADPTATTIVVTTHRGMYRSEDGGSNWGFKDANLPAHLESGPVVRDPTDARTLYAVFSLMPYTVVWRTAVEGGNLLARVDTVSLLGGLAFVLLLMICGVLLARWLAQSRAAAPSPRRSLS